MGKKLSKRKHPIFVIILILVSLFSLNSLKESHGTVPPAPGFEFIPIKINPNNSAYLWAVNLSKEVWGFNHIINVLRTTDLNADSLPDVLVGTNFGIAALNGTNGTLLWYYAVESVSNVELCDLDGDMLPEIIMNSALSGIIVLNRTGGRIWQNQGISAKMNEVIEVMSQRYILSTSPSKKLFCLNGSTGEEMWNITFDQSLDILKAVDTNGDSIKEGLIVSYNKLFVLNITNMNFLWNFSTQRQINVLDMGYLDTNNESDLLIGTEDNKILALNGSNGQVIWQKDESYDIVALKAMNTDLDSLTDLIAYTCWGNAYYCSFLYYLNATTGIKFSTKFSLIDGNTIGMVHDLECGDFDGDGLQNDIAISTEYHKTYAIKGMDSIIWERTTEDAFTDIVVSDLNNDSKDDVIIGTFGGAIYAIDSNIAVEPDLGGFASENYLTSNPWREYYISTPYHNKEYYINILIRNLGTADNMEFNYSVFIDEILPENLIFEESRSLYSTSLNDFTVDWFIPFDLTGAHTIIIQIDSKNEIDETDETNNQIKIQIIIKWNLNKILGYLFLSLGITVAILDIIVYYLRKRKEFPSFKRESKDGFKGGR